MRIHLAAVVLLTTPPEPGDAAAAMWPPVRV